MRTRFATRTLLFVSLALAGAVSAQAASAATPSTRANVSALKDSGHYDRFIITYSSGSLQHSDRAVMMRDIDGAVRRAGLDKAKIAGSGQALGAVQASFQRRLAIGSDLVRTSRKLDRNEAAALMSQIAADPSVLDVTPDVMMYRDPLIKAPDLFQPAAFTPNDTYYPFYQWHLKAPDGAITYFGDANLGGANVSGAWDIADGSNVVIAVLDTGITQHVDVDTSLADAGYDFISDAFVSGRPTDDRVPGGWDLGDWTTTEPWLSACTSPSRPPESSSWHGTHVASTAGAELTNNARGMAGIAYNAKVLPVRVLGHCGGYTSDIADAIVWAAGGHIDGVPDNQYPADVINLSLGGGGTCRTYDPTGWAVHVANQLGAVVVVSAGNSNDDARNYSPASCPGVITVAATGVTGKRAYYSNYGMAVEIAAPGGGVYQDDDPATGVVSYDGFVWQALNNGSTTPVALGTSYSGYAGTSQAAPHVAGTVALMQSARKALGLRPLKPLQVLAILRKTAMRPSFSLRDNHHYIGAGIVDAQAAVEASINGTRNGAGGVVQ
ncbi:S8 family serine peptidase [Oleiagrimonas soli]|uniref:Protease n=1 Tax=Oleiagrimonas soli TaxID=1543381 RepID=A0A099CWI7_9GAMM|nr:S8 family serine peptidase [Oleiagrimonas soli]KGI78099.1 protease [Oleiagrimonas soli]MBB6183472.1 serine protease [Oleiagrimonas soli]